METTPCGNMSSKCATSLQRKPDSCTRHTLKPERFLTNGFVFVKHWQPWLDTRWFWNEQRRAEGTPTVSPHTYRTYSYVPPSVSGTIGIW